MSLSSELAKYQADRAALVASDRSLRHDHIRSTLSTIEAKADAVVRKIRAEEASSIWSAQYPDVPHPFPGMEFLTGE